VFAPTVLMSTIPVHDEDTGEVSTMHIVFPSREDFASFVDGLFAEGLDASDVTLDEVPSTWECSGRDGCIAQA
jgi:hypothetical protein